MAVEIEVERKDPEERIRRLKFGFHVKLSNLKHAKVTVAARCFDSLHTNFKSRLASLTPGSFHPLFEIHLKFALLLANVSVPPHLHKMEDAKRKAVHVALRHIDSHRGEYATLNEQNEVLSKLVHKHNLTNVARGKQGLHKLTVEEYRAKLQNVVHHAYTLPSDWRGSKIAGLFQHGTKALRKDYLDNIGFFSHRDTSVSSEEDSDVELVVSNANYARSEEPQTTTKTDNDEIAESTASQEQLPDDQPAEKHDPRETIHEPSSSGDRWKPQEPLPPPDYSPLTPVAREPATGSKRKKAKDDDQDRGSPKRKNRTELANGTQNAPKDLQIMRRLHALSDHKVRSALDGLFAGSMTFATRIK